MSDFSVANSTRSLLPGSDEAEEGSRFRLQATYAIARCSSGAQPLRAVAPGCIDGQAEPPQYIFFGSFDRRMR